MRFEGSDLEGAASRCAEKLVRDKILFKKQLGGGKFQYNAYVNEVSGAELDKFKAEIDRKTTSSLITEQLPDKTTVTDAITLGGALKLPMSCATSPVLTLILKSSNFGIRKLTLRTKSLLSYALQKMTRRVSLSARKIRDALKDGSYHMIFIDATTSPFGKDGYGQYRNEMAQSMYQTGKR